MTLEEALKETTELPEEWSISLIADQHSVSIFLQCSIDEPYLWFDDSDMGCESLPLPEQIISAIEFAKRKQRELSDR